MFKKKTLVKPGEIIRVDHVRLEEKKENITPDVIIEVAGRELLVEIKVTHGIDDEKLDKIKEKNFNVIEYDFSKMNRIVVNSQHVRRVLTDSYKGAKKGYGMGKWINHYLMKETIDELNEEYKKNMVLSLTLIKLKKYLSLKGNSSLFLTC